MISRRRILSQGASLLALSATGCGQSLEKTYAGFSTCSPPTKAGLVIDAHCHLLNQKDGSARELVANRVLNLDEDEKFPGAAWMVGTLAQFVGELLGIATQTVRAENIVVDVELRKRANDPLNNPARVSNRDLCFFADRNQAGIIRANDDRQITGFFSNRLRNAAQLMYLFPDVDLFLPSMVDFYEGTTRVNYRNQIAFYSNLALITRGRFLPLASFSPEREYDEREKGWGPDDSFEKKSQFYWLKRAITHLGFVGVKVHPSSGFSPIDNLAYGCTNRARKYETKTDRELFARFTAYDQYMADLIDFCKEQDVPILTHGNIGLTVANEGCMTGQRPSAEDTPRGEPQGAIGDPEKGEWYYPFGAKHREKAENLQKSIANSDRQIRLEEDYTSSPKSWDAAMKAANKRHPQRPNAKVIMAHFSGSLTVQKNNNNNTVVRPSPWLQNAAQLVRSNKDLYVDLSEMSQLFHDKNGAAYRDVFRRYVAQKTALKEQLIYGSDWHMPGTALVGRDYINGIKDLLPTRRDTKQIMGERAADVFGLRKGTQNLARLERFFAQAPTIWGPSRAKPEDQEINPALQPADISWWSKI